LKLSATLNADDGKLFTNDFVLRYFRSDGKEARIECKAIARADSPGLGESCQFYPGGGSWIRVYGGTVYFCLVFYMQNDVNTIDIHRIGISEPISYRIGSDRSYSVYIASNSNPKTLAAAEELVRNGGYYVSTTNGLDEEETGVTIYYQDKVENQAREISQRLMTKLGIIPTIRKMELITDFDVVVWFGK
jgi:hypothetical protein